MIAIIPARGGSKGLPRKNIKKLDGIPLIGYTIKAALNAKCIDKVIVTTDDEEIASIAKEYGADIPFIRPGELATDTSLAVDVYLHVINFFNERLQSPIDKFMVLLPTVPFRTERHIDAAYQLFREKGCTTLISVKEAETPPSWYMYQNVEGKLQNCNYGREKAYVRNRQMDGGYVIPNGAIYILDYRLLKDKRTYYFEDTIGYLMDKRDSVDIDTMDDFLYAEFLMKEVGGK